MNESILINYNKSGFTTHLDFAEKVGNLGVGLLSIGLGKQVTVKVEKSSITGEERVTFNSFKHSPDTLKTRIAAIGVFLCLIPITLPLLLVGFLGKKFSKSYQMTMQSQKEQNLAAIKIQKHIRGHLVRKAHLPRNMHSPGHTLYQDYANQCRKTNAKDADLIPRAKDGNTPVYLPQEMPKVILKKSGRDNAILRFQQMQHVRSIVSSQKSSHLTIPRANLFEKFLVEERLPIQSNCIHNMELYTAQPELFDEAVREMTRLFSVMSIGDLVIKGTNYLGKIAGVKDYVRYDNLPFYIIEKNGKKEGMLGLIDLEQSYDGPSPEGIVNLARIFPYHVDVIKNEAKRLNMKVDEAAIELAAMKGKKSLDFVFNDHHQWLQQKKVSTHKNDQGFLLSTETKQMLIAHAKSELLAVHQKFDEKFLKDPNLIDELAENLVSEMIRILKSEIKKAQKSKDVSTENLSSSEQVDFRSIRIERFEFYNSVACLMNENTNINEIFQSSPLEKMKEVDKLLCAVLQGFGGNQDIFRVHNYNDGPNYVLIQY